MRRCIFKLLTCRCVCVFDGSKEQILQQLKPFSGLLIAASPREGVAHKVHPFSETNPSAVGNLCLRQGCQDPDADFKSRTISPLWGTGWHSAFEVVCSSLAAPVLPIAGSLPPLKVGFPPGSAQNWSTASIMQHFVPNSAEFCDEYIRLSFVPHSPFFFLFFLSLPKKDAGWQLTHSLRLWLADCVRNVRVRRVAILWQKTSSQTLDSKDSNLEILDFQYLFTSAVI